MTFPKPDPAVIAALAPTGALRTGINMRNFLLVTDTAEGGSPIGVSPDMAAALAEQLGVPLVLMPYDTPALLADDAINDAWDIGNVGATKVRGATINFSQAYAEIEATYLVRGDSPFQDASEMDQAGLRVVVSAKTAYDNWLDVNTKHTELVRAEGNEATLARFLEGGIDALAGLRPGLIETAKQVEGSRLLSGRFTAVQQAMGTPKSRPDAGVAYLRKFVDAALSSGFVAELIERHSVVGLSAAI